jgi:predicted transcriptional regulator
MKYRSRAEISAMVLTASTAGATKTRLMYAAYLSYAQATEYLAFLQEKGLIFRETGTHLYKLTEKGLHFLHTYDKISEFISVSNINSSEPAQSAAESATSSLQA